MWPFYLISSMSSQPNTDLLKLVSDRNDRAFSRFGATGAVALLHAGLLHKLLGFLVRYMALFRLLLEIDSFKWFWMGSLKKITQLLLMFLEAPVLIFHFSHYKSMTFLTMLSIICYLCLMIRLSNLNVIRHVATTRVGSWIWI